MHPAPTKSDIENWISHSDRTNSILVVFSPYSETPNPHCEEFLRFVNEFHYHSGSTTQMFCAGYAQYGSQDPKRAGIGLSLEHLNFFPLTYYYPDLFSKLRREVSQSLEGKWNYTTGVDLLLFSSFSQGQKQVDWSQAAIVQSKNTVGTIFQNVEDMVRTVLNVNEAENGLMTPELLKPTMNRKQLGHSLRGFAQRFGGDVIAGGAGLLSD